MKKSVIIIILSVLAVAALIAAGWYFARRPGALPETDIDKYADLIKVSKPASGSKVLSPIEIEGEARGNWYFEASFPVKLYDSSGELLAQGIAQAMGEWMTENFVPFKTYLEFPPPSTDSGFLVLEKDNPSGLPENADELRIPVTF